jgi:hypothetical protein
MILSVHQPQYLPWLGYFHKIANCDSFVFLDDVQFKKREFQNRNKIKTPSGPLWLTVPVATKGHFDQLIKDVRINNEENWAAEHYKSIEHNYHRSPHFIEHEEFFRKLYEKKWDFLIDISMELIRYMLSYLKIETPAKYSSEFQVKSFSTQRIIDLCRCTGSGAYLSGSGGRDYMDMALFDRNNIAVMFQDFKHPEYAQMFEGFEPYLSIIDLVFNCGHKSREILLTQDKQEKSQ